MKEEELCNHLIHASDGSRCANPKPCKWHGTYREGYDVALKDFAATYKRDEEIAFDNGYIKAIYDIQEAIEKSTEQRGDGWTKSAIVKLLDSLKP